MAGALDRDGDPPGRADGKGVLICPIAFVSEHVETLVELDHEYAELAARWADALPAGARRRASRRLHRRLAPRGAGSLDRDGVAPHGPWRCPAGMANAPAGREGGMSWNWYDLLRGLHIIAVIAWMAG
jgi:ferrochelatase